MASTHYGIHGRDSLQNFDFFGKCSHYEVYHIWIDDGYDSNEMDESKNNLMTSNQAN